MKQIAAKFLIVTMSLAIVAAASISDLSAGWEFLFRASHVTNDEQVFLNLTVKKAGYDREELEPWLPGIGDLERDLPVILFLAKKSGKPISRIAKLRAKGMSWSEIFAVVEVPLDVLFVGMDRDPGPPYGKAWGHWKKHPKKADYTDAAIASLIHIQVAHKLTGISVDVLARAGGRDSVIGIVADKNGRPHAKGKSAKEKPEDHPGSGKGRGKG